jgi:hypothetical protein
MAALFVVALQLLPSKESCCDRCFRNGFHVLALMFITKGPNETEVHIVLHYATFKNNDPLDCVPYWLVEVLIKLFSGIAFY